VSYETAPASVFDDSAAGQGKTAPADRYASPAIITSPLDIAHLALGTDDEGNGDGYGAKWDDYVPLSGGVMSGDIAQMPGTDQVG
jgi:hypothetical protein